MESWKAYSRASNDPPFAIKTRLLIATNGFQFRFDLLFRVSFSFCRKPIHYPYNLLYSLSILLRSRMFRTHYNILQLYSEMILREQVKAIKRIKKITNNALINIEYAIPYTATINEAKVHIKWLTRL